MNWCQVGESGQGKRTMKALIIIDMQMEMLHRMEGGRDHVNSDAPARIAELSDAFRQNGLPVVHVRHCASESGQPLHPDAPGFQPMACAISLGDEPVFFKQTSSAFASTDLAAYLRDKGITD